MSPDTPTPDTPIPDPSDDDLGRELGEQLRRRADGGAAPDGDFEGVERRARAIGTRRWLAAAAAAVGVIVAGLAAVLVVGDDDPSGVETLDPQPDAPSTTAPVTTEPPTTQPPATTTEPPTTQPPTTQSPATTTGPVDGADWRPIEELGLDAEPAPIDPGWDPPGVALVGVPAGDAVVVLPDGSATRVLTGAALGRVMVAADGSILAEVTDRPAISNLRPTATAVVQIRDGEYRELSPDGSLDGVAELDGEPVAFVGDLPPFQSVDPEIPDGDTGDLRVVDLGSGESSVFVEDAYGIEWSVSEVFVGGDGPDEIVFVEAAGYQPDWRYYDTGGDQLDLASPTDGRYGPDWGNEVDGVGPDVADAVLSADGSTLDWAEYELGEPAELTPSAVIHSMDLATGTEAPTFAVSLGRSIVYLNPELTRAGASLVLDRWFFEPDDTGAQRPTHLPPILVDLGDGSSTELGLPGADWYHVP